MSSILKFDIFESIYNFFVGFENLIGFQELCYIVFGLFIAMTIITFIRASLSYEVKLIKAIDKINAYLNLNPHINDDNLIAFNDKMKRVPKELRKQWQQFMLYREQPASYYMSYKQCVENPVKTSVYKQQIKFLNIVTYMLAFLSFFLSINLTTVAADITLLFRQIFIIPIIILVLNWLITIFMNARINAITSDLFSNFHYFQLNMDKATKSLPEYVDYEVLFTKKEIKQGIPVLFEYLEKRTQIEQEELERARLKNIEHDRYNFEKMTVESSLVLERAMNEAETYHANRRKLMTEIDQITTEVNNIQNNYKQATKDYQRKMQASKENLERLKQQMEQAASNIEANYIKKQQSDEINRQQGLERDFDNVTARQKKDLQNLQTEIEKREAEIEKSRTLLENAMMSEFDSYSHKVYDKLENVLEEKTQDKFDALTKEKNELAEAFAKQKDELENIYAQYQVQSEKFAKQTVELESQLAERDYAINQIKQTGLRKKDRKAEQPIQSRPAPSFVPTTVEPNSQKLDLKKSTEESAKEIEESKFDFKPENVTEEVEKPSFKLANEENDIEQPKFDFKPEVETDEVNETKFGFPTEDQEEVVEEPKFEIKQEEDKQTEVKKPKFSFEEQEEPTEPIEVPKFDFDKDIDDIERKLDLANKLFEAENPDDEEPKDDGASEIELPVFEDEKEDKSISLPEIEKTDVYTSGKTDYRFEQNEPRLAIPFEEAIKIDFENKKQEAEKVTAEAPKRRGRPKKVVTEENQEEPKRGRGRPRKTEDEEDKSESVEAPKKSRGRPRKTEKETVETIAKKAKPGRPRKTDDEYKSVETPKKRRGRPRKTEIETVETTPKKTKPGRPRKTENVSTTTKKKGRGRPRKTEIDTVEITPKKAKPGRPKKTENISTTTKKKGRGRPRKTENDSKTTKKKGRGRPKKN